MLNTNLSFSEKVSTPNIEQVAMQDGYAKGVVQVGEENPIWWRFALIDIE